MEKDFNDHELFELMTMIRNDNIERTLDTLIGSCRFAQKQYLQEKSEYSGHEMLKSFLDNGAIKMNTYLKVRELIDNPNADYKINITDV